MINWIRGWWTTFRIWRADRDTYNFLVSLEGSDMGDYIEVARPGTERMSWAVDTKRNADDEAWEGQGLTDEPVELEMLLWQSLDRGDAEFRVKRIP